MSNFLFANGKVPNSRIRYHTPTTFRTQRRLTFSCSTTNNAATPLQPLPPGVSPPRPSFPPVSAHNGGNSASFFPPHAQIAPQQQYIMPWEIPGAKTSSLYKTSPPKILYPTGSRDEETNQHFLKQLDMYLFSNFQVRSILVGDRPHPFSGYSRLSQYYSQLGQPDWEFDTTTTFATLQEIRQNGHTNFYQELYELLWFGGVLSFGNIMRETYAVMYSLFAVEDLPDVEGLCEVDDGVSFRLVIIESLRVVRPKHTQEIISRLYTKIDETKLVLRPGGMSAYFARLNKFRLKMKKQGEIVSEAYLLRRTTLAVSGKHKVLKDAVKEMRKIAGVSGKPTTFAAAKDCLLDTFHYEIPDGHKIEKQPPTIDANFAGTQQYSGKRRRNGGGQQHYKRGRRNTYGTHPKGS